MLLNKDSQFKLIADIDKAQKQIEAGEGVVHAMARTIILAKLKSKLEKQ